MAAQYILNAHFKMPLNSRICNPSTEKYQTNNFNEQWQKALQIVVYDIQKF